MANLTVSTDIDAFMASADNAAARGSLGAGTGNGDMLKSTYDPQNAGKISGGTIGFAAGGTLSMVGNNGTAGSIKLDAGTGNGDTMQGGSIRMDGGTELGTPGGQLQLQGGGSADAGGGDVKTFGATAPGGSIITYDGGGSINTRGVGSIELGAAGTRTTLTGTASANRAITLPDKPGTLAIDVSDVEAASSITPAADGTYSVPTSITIVKGIITAIS